MSDASGMTFWDHLDELRGVIVRMLAAVSVKDISAVVTDVPSGYVSVMTADT